MHLPKDGGDPALALVAVADHGQAQMIVLGNKGLTGVRRISGSLPKTVSRQAGCDVLIVPTQSGLLPELAGGSVVVGRNGEDGATRVTRHTREQDPADALLQVADATNAAVVVVGGTAAGGQAVADKLVSKAVSVR